MNGVQLIGALELGCIYSLISIAVFISFRVLKFPDLSVDGTFPLGAAVCASALLNGLSPSLALLLAFVSGCLGGLFTAILVYKFRVLNLLAGIITMTALYSINIRVMGNKPNLSLLGTETIFEIFPAFPILGQSFWFLLSIVFVLLLVLTLYFSTDSGLALRAVGVNEKTAQAQGIYPSHLVSFGISLSNGLVALAGGLFAQLFGFADVTLGVGTIIAGLASLILGEALIPTRTILYCLIGTIIGALVYRIMIALALSSLGDLGLEASDLNLMTSALVVISMSVPNIRKKILSRLQRLQNSN